jgi:hypothetical protein
MVKTQSPRTTVETAQNRPVPSAAQAASQVAIIATSVLAGAVMATWLVELSLGSSGTPWTEYHQATAPAYTVVLPSIGGLALIAALTALLASWRDPHRRLLLCAVAFLLIGLTVTAGVHFPINDEIASWQSTAPPTDWGQTRDRWLLAHAGRTSFLIASLVLLVIASHSAASRSYPLD